MCKIYCLYAGGSPELGNLKKCVKLGGCIVSQFDKIVIWGIDKIVYKGKAF